MTGKRPRPYIGIRFRCCNVYARVYLNKAGTAYVGFCPRCARKAEARVSPAGSQSRFWSAG